MKKTILVIALFLSFVQYSCNKSNSTTQTTQKLTLTTTDGGTKAFTYSQGEIGNWDLQQGICTSQNANIYPGFNFNFTKGNQIFSMLSLGFTTKPVVGNYTLHNVCYTNSSQCNIDLSGIDISELWGGLYQVMYEKTGSVNVTSISSNEFSFEYNGTVDVYTSVFATGPSVVKTIKITGTGLKYSNL